MLESIKNRSISLGYRISRLFRMNTCLIDHWTKGFSMHCGQIPYIISIVEKEGLTQDELSTTVHLDRGHTARMLKTMEASGLIKREKNSENRRQKLVYPTAKGKARYQALMPVLSRHNAVMFRGFSAEEKNTAITILDRVIANIQSELDGERI